MKRRNIFIVLVFSSLLIVTGNFIFNKKSSENINNAFGFSSSEANEKKTTSSQRVGSEIEIALQDTIEMALDDFQNKMRFPFYSVPINNNNWNALNPRAFEAIPKPLFNEDGFISELRDIKVSLEVERFIVDVNQDLPVQVKVVPEKENSLIDLELANIKLARSNNPYHSDDGERINLQRTWQSADQEAISSITVFSGVIPSEVLQTFGESDVHLVAELIFSDGTEAMSGAAIKLFESTANLERIGDAYVYGSHLMIPVDIYTQTSGYFRIQANLFDQMGELPIAHLTEEIKTDEAGFISGAFKTHIATLKEKRNQGPYLLKNINISKIPTKPDYKPRYGSYDNSSYSIRGFSFDSYKDEDYVHPDMARRFAALKKISNQN